MPTPLPHQLSGADFLADPHPRKHKLLADEPRVGKTGTNIIACDYVGARKILVLTTASGRAVWRAGFEEWQAFPRTVECIFKAPAGVYRGYIPKADVVITSWSLAAQQRVLSGLCQRGRYDVLILDESHYAGDPATKRTMAVYGVAGDPEFWALADISDRVWCNSGTPIPKTPNSLHPMLRKLAPELLKARRGDSWEWPDVTAYDDFLHRYCTVKKEFRAGQWVEIIQHAQRTDELGQRLDGFFRRLRQVDVGITEPIYEILPLHVDEMNFKRVKAIFAGLDEEAILNAAKFGTTDQLEMHLAPLRRLTGKVKALALVDLLKEEFANGLDKIVLFCWHTDVGKLLEAELKEFGADYLDGSSSPAYRDFAVNAFRTDPAARVLIGQMAAMGEAVDLSVANETIMVELDSVPARMKQAALRITNLTQKRLPRVRVAALDGSIDEPLAKILTRRVADIKTIMEPTK